jgi:hypothetical protein
MRLAVVGAFAVVVPHTVAACSARFALHDTAHTLVGIVFYVEQCAVHGSVGFSCESHFQPCRYYHLTVAFVAAGTASHRDGVVAPFLFRFAANAALDFVSWSFHSVPPFSKAAAFSANR